MLASPSTAAAATGCVQTGSPGPQLSEWTCRVDPITVAGYEVKEDVTAPIPKPPISGHITHLEVDLVDEDGTPIPINRLMLHHVVFLNAFRRDRTCPDGYVGFDERPIIPGYGPERFYAAGEERAKITFPAGYGYQIAEGDAWAMVYMLMNHRRATDTAFVEYELRIDTSGSLKSARPYWLDVNNCRADPIYNVPGVNRRLPRRKKRARSTHIRSRDFTIRENGWIVAGAGHVHGGARRLTITKPDCNGLEVARSVPTWGLASHPFYNVRPILHEPGPIGMSAFRTAGGIPVRAGQRIRLNSIYGNWRPHTRVMGIFVVYVSPERADPPGPATPQACGGAPGDIVYGRGTDLPGRRGPVKFTVPLTRLDSNGNAITVGGPPGRFRRLRSRAKVRVGDRFFWPPNVVLRQGARLKYVFAGSEPHSLTLANGPLGIGSPNLDGGRSFTQRFRRPGVYRFFCDLHPVQMSQRVIVKRRKRR